MGKNTTMSVSKELLDRLAMFGKPGESKAKWLKRALDAADGNGEYEHLYYYSTIIGNAYRYSTEIFHKPLDQLSESELEEAIREAGVDSPGNEWPHKYFEIAHRLTKRSPEDIFQDVCIITLGEESDKRLAQMEKTLGLTREELVCELLRKILA